MFSISKHPIIRTVAWNTGFQVVGKAISSVAGLLVTLIIATTYGPSGYGDFVKITTFVSFFYLLADFGINAIALKKWERISDPPTSPIYQTLVGLRILLGTSLVIVANTIVFLLPTGDNQGYTHLVKVGILLLSPAILAQGLITTANAYFQRKLRYDYATRGLLVGSIISVPALWLLSRLWPTPSGIIAATSVVGMSYIVTAAYGMIVATGKNKKFLVDFQPLHMKSLFTAAIPFGLTLLFNTLYFRIDSVIMTLYRSTEEVGIYGYVYKFFEVPLVVPTFFMNAVYPLLLTAKKDAFQKLATKSLLLLTTASLFITAGLWICAPFLAIVRTEFAAGINLYRILILGLPFFFISSLLMWILVARGRQKTLLGIYGTSMLLAIICNYIFVPTYGALAASWITVLGELFVVVLLGIAIISDRTQNE